MIKITVPALPIRNQVGVSTKTGKPYDMDFQVIYCHTADQTGQPLPFPEKTELMLAKGDKKGHPPGVYTLSADSLYVDRDGKLAVAPKLVPLPAKS